MSGTSTTQSTMSFVTVSPAMTSTDWTVPETLELTWFSWPPESSSIFAFWASIWR